MRIAAMGDLHCGLESAGRIRPMLKSAEKEADLILWAGDLTTIGLVEEMEVLLGEASGIQVPLITVVGNHDHESDQANLLIKMMTKEGICVLDATTCEIDGIGFVGTKGFCGGFSNRRIQPFGERAIKSFVQSSVNEVIRMEDALETLHTDHKVALLHYAPVRETLEGESPELFPFLGSSLLADALDRHGVDVIFHGHAHNGSPEGRTPGGIPVHNVSRFVQRRSNQRDYFIFTI